MARLVKNGAIVSDDGQWCWAGWRWVALTANPTTKAPRVFGSERTVDIPG